MWGEIDCPSCGGTGNEPVSTGSLTEPAQSNPGHRLEVSAQTPGIWVDGDFYSGTFPCGDCNGDGKQSIWLDTCRPCGGSGQAPRGGPCPRCKGLGYHEAEPSSKGSWYEIIEG
jgi:RecJ-like exonuclease